MAAELGEGESSSIDEFEFTQQQSSESITATLHHASNEKDMARAKKAQELTSLMRPAAEGMNAVQNSINTGESRHRGASGHGWDSISTYDEQRSRHVILSATHTPTLAGSSPVISRHREQLPTVEARTMTMQGTSRYTPSPAATNPTFISYTTAGPPGGEGSPSRNSSSSSVQALRPPPSTDLTAEHPAVHTSSALDQSTSRPNKTVTTSPQGETLLFNAKTLTDWYSSRFNELPQKSSKVMLKVIIREVWPVKSTHYPYNGSKIPPWWPPELRHREPDHLLKEERNILLAHVMREIDFALPRIDQLERAVANATRLLPPHSLALIRDLFMVMKQERKAIQDNKGIPVKMLRVQVPPVDADFWQAAMARNPVIPENPTDSNHAVSAVTDSSNGLRPRSRRLSNANSSTSSLTAHPYQQLGRSRPQALSRSHSLSFSSTEHLVPTPTVKSPEAGLASDSGGSGSGSGKTPKRKRLSLARPPKQHVRPSGLPSPLISAAVSTDLNAIDSTETAGVSTSSPTSGMALALSRSTSPGHSYRSGSDHGSIPRSSSAHNVESITRRIEAVPRVSTQSWIVPSPRLRVAMVPPAPNAPAPDEELEPAPHPDNIIRSDARPNMLPATHNSPATREHSSHHQYYQDNSLYAAIQIPGPRSHGQDQFPQPPAFTTMTTMQSAQDPPGLSSSHEYHNRHHEYLFAPTPPSSQLSFAGPTGSDIHPSGVENLHAPSLDRDYESNDSLRLDQKSQSHSQYYYTPDSLVGSPLFQVHVQDHHTYHQPQQQQYHLSSTSPPSSMDTSPPSHYYTDKVSADGHATSHYVYSSSSHHDERNRDLAPARYTPLMSTLSHIDDDVDVTRLSYPSPELFVHQQQTIDQHQLQEQLARHPFHHRDDPSSDSHPYGYYYVPPPAHFVYAPSAPESAATLPASFIQPRSRLIPFEGQDQEQRAPDQIQQQIDNGRYDFDHHHHHQYGLKPPNYQQYHEHHLLPVSSYAYAPPPPHFVEATAGHDHGSGSGPGLAGGLMFYQESEANEIR